MAMKKAMGPEVSGRPTSQPPTAWPQRRLARLAVMIRIGVRISLRAKVPMGRASSVSAVHALDRVNPSSWFDKLTVRILFSPIQSPLKDEVSNLRIAGDHSGWPKRAMAWSQTCWRSSSKISAGSSDMVDQSWRANSTSSWPGPQPA